MREVTKLAPVEEFLRLEAEEISVFTFDIRRPENCSKIEALTG